MNCTSFLLHQTRLGIAAGLILAVGLAVGCAPEGNSGGRIDSYKSTESDAKSNGPSIPALLEFGDQTAAALAQDLMDIDEVRNAKTKLVLELGSILNQTSTPTSDFEQLRNRLRGQIFASKLLRNHFLIVESRQRMDAERERIVGDNQPGVQPSSDRYDPSITYVLQGDFFESTRLDRRQYYFEFKLTNLQTRAIVFQKSFDLGQVTVHED